MTKISQSIRISLWIAGAFVLFAFPVLVNADAQDPYTTCDPVSDTCNDGTEDGGPQDTFKFECKDDGTGTGTDKCLIKKGEVCPAEVSKGEFCDKNGNDLGGGDQQVSPCTDVGGGNLQCQPVALDAGDACLGDEQCTLFDPDLECVKAASGKRCVANPGVMSIGTWCDLAAHCNTQEGFLKLTCNKDKNYCVGASLAVECADSDLNSNSDLGETVVPTFERCDRSSLFCNPQFVCQRDLGGEFGSDIGVGRSTEDIRDQIRRIINIALGFLGVAGVIVVLYGGAIWMSAAGDDEKVEKAKKTIVSGLIGLVIIGIAWTIVSYVLSVTQIVGGG